MSIFNELLPKINEISKSFTKNFSDELKAALESLDKFETDLNAKSKARDLSQKDKNQTVALQSIHEEEDAITKAPEDRRQSSKSSERISTESLDRGAKKRSKHEVDGMESPEVEKRPKRNASVKAQSVISEQVNLNLTKKIRRETSTQKRRRRKDEDKENDPEPIVQVKQEKISLPPPEPVDLEPLPINVNMKQEIQEETAMPPPPVPKPRKKVDKQEEVIEEDTTRRRTTRTRKQTDTLPAPAPARDARARRQRNKVQETSTTESEKETTAVENEPASPAEKPRPKRTKRTQKTSEKKEVEKEIVNSEPEVEISPKELQQYTQSPVLQKVKPKATKQKANETQDTDQNTEITHLDEPDTQLIENHLEKTKIISQLNCTVTINKEMNNTIVLPNGVYNHAPVTPKNVRQMDETVVLERQKEKNIMNATVVIEGVPDRPECDTNHISASSLLTDDSDDLEPTTPPRGNPPPQEHASAVKEKVQQFEEMASRVTRTKTRAMAKKEEPTENQTPPERSQPAITPDTLCKMNNMIFNGKPPQISTSATKPRTNIPLKSVGPSSTSKLSAIKVQEEERREKEDARRKKEALLEAKREQQRSKREQKMSAAALARSAAESSRRAALQAAAMERRERQAHADQGRAERLKEAERKRLELARKAAETEERRRQEEAARAQRRADDQKRADAARKRQQEEASAVKKEAALMQREIERRQKEFMERMKMKQRMEGDRMTPHKTPATPMEPVYMQDGFQHLNSDEEEPPERPAPVWCTSKVRRVQLCRQALLSSQHVDRLFSVREHTPDLREIFPNIERARLKRTSSAVWRTPPRLPPLNE